MQRLRILRIGSLIVVLMITCFALSGAAASYDPQGYQAQKILKKLGCNSGSLDGLWGKTTQSAVKRSQRDVGFRLARAQ
jgi:peptidoglycan hydrolase-like protein with peptidoglycan-binding domain